MAKTFDEVMERFRSIAFEDEFDMIVAIANGGIVPAGIINQRLQKEIHLLKINLRDEYQSMISPNFWHQLTSISEINVFSWWMTV